MVNISNEKMKKTSFLILCAVLLLGAMGCNKPAQLTGNIDLPDGTKLMLRDLSTEMADCVDSAIVKDKAFTFTKRQKAGIYGIDTQQNFYVVKLGDEPLSLDATAGEGQPVRYEGKESGMLNEYEQFTAEFVAKLNPLRKQESSLMAAPESPERDAQMKELEVAYNEAHTAFNEGVLGLVMKNPNDSYALYLATTLELSGESLDRLAGWASELDESSKGTSFYRILMERIATEQKLQPGKPFVDFAPKTVDGQIVKLSDIAGKGKPVLVELWASWCRACRASMPKLIATYEKYKDKFVMFAVSCDEDHAKWQEAVAKDGMPWVNYISDNMMDPNSPMHLYGTSSLPFNVLIDAEGKIVDRNVDHDRLVAYLESLAAASAEAPAEAEMAE